MKFVKALLGRSTPSELKQPELTDSHLLALARNELDWQPDPQTVENRIQSLHYGETLRALVTTESRYQKSATRTLATQLEQGQVNLRQLRQDIDDLERLLSIAALTGDPQLSETLLADFHNDDALLTLCLRTPSASLRHQLAERIHDEAALQAMAKAFKNKDKTCYRLARQRLDALKEARKQNVEREAAEDQLLEALLQHSQRQYNHEYAFKLESLKRRRAELAEQAPTDWQQHSNTLVAACEAVLAEGLKLEEAQRQDEARAQQPQKEARPEEAAPTPADPQFEQLLDNYAAILNAVLQLPPTEISVEELRKKLNGIAENWLHLKSSHIPSSTQQHAQVALSEALQQVLQQWEHQAETSQARQTAFAEDAVFAAREQACEQLRHWLKPLKHLPRHSAIINESPLFTALNKVEASLHAARQSEVDKHKQIGGMIKKAQAALRDGQLKRAQGIRYSAAERLEECAHVPAHLSRQWQELLEKLEEVSDWQSYAIVPKLESLVADMQALATTPLTPELQATRIHHLQDEWKAITKGSGGRHQALWDSFKAAADEAFEPCKQHYQALDAEREANTHKREALIEQLSVYLDSYDWEQADWGQVEKVLRSARKEWQGYSPALRASQQTLQKQFNDKLDAIQAHLNGEYEKNKAEKQRLIASLEPLTKTEDLQHAIDTAIRFQQQWKGIGRCRRKDDDALWQQFRGLCDTIFARRDAERNAQKAEVQRVVDEAETAIVAIEALLNIDEADFESAYREWQQSAEAVTFDESLPRAQQAALSKRLQRASDAVEKRFQGLQAQRAQQGWDSLFALKADINAKQDAQDALREALEALTFTPGNTQKHLLNAIDSTDEAENSDPARLLCIRAEIASGTSSPDEDKEMRMQYQVEQLQAGLGQQRESQVSLANDWLALPRLPEGDYLRLQERFLASWRKVS